MVRSLLPLVWLLASTDGESLFSLGCSSTNNVCYLYKIDIDQSSGRAVSNEITQWYQKNVANSFGSIAGFNQKNLPYIIFTTACDHQAYLINITDVHRSPSPIGMKTACTQPLHTLPNGHLLVLATTQNNNRSSSPQALSLYDAISGYWIRGKSKLK